MICNMEVNNVLILMGANPDHLEGACCKLCISAKNARDILPGDNTSGPRRGFRRRGSGSQKGRRGPCIQNCCFCGILNLGFDHVQDLARAKRASLEEQDPDDDIGERPCHSN